MYYFVAGHKGLKKKLSHAYQENKMLMKGTYREFQLNAFEFLF